MDHSLGELRYKVKIQFRGDATAIETRFLLHPTPALVTQNHVKKPRMGGWRLEGVQRSDGAFSMGAVLARVERLLYFSGPAPGLVQRPIVVHFGGRSCPLWQVQVSPDLSVYAYLAEISPGLLALSYLSGSFSNGDIVSLELQLEDFRLSPGVAPAEDGTALLTTLQRMAAEAVRAEAAACQGNVVEVVQMD